MKLKLDLLLNTWYCLFGPFFFKILHPYSVESTLLQVVSERESMEFCKEIYGAPIFDVYDDEEQTFDVYDSEDPKFDVYDDEDRICVDGGGPGGSFGCGDNPQRFVPRSTKNHHNINQPTIRTYMNQSLFMSELTVLELCEADSMVCVYVGNVVTNRIDRSTLEKLSCWESELEYQGDESDGDEKIYVSSLIS